jgi:putative transposase
MFKATKYRLYPKEEQKVLLDKHFGCSRLIYNFGLELKNKTYQETGKSISRYDIQAKLPELKIEKPFLKEVNSLSLQATLVNLETAFSKFFKKESDYPKFKCKGKSTDSFQVVQNVEVIGNKLHIPKFKDGIEIVISRPIVGEIKTCTISKTPTNKYFISISTGDGKELPIPNKLDLTNAIGIDLGIKTFATLSTGEKFDNPKHLSKKLKKLKKQQKILSRRKKESNRRKKQKLKVAIIHEKIKNCRKDFHHKLSTKIVDENQVICIEDLAVKNMVKNRKLSKAISDCGWSQFVSFLSYKANWNGKTIIKIGRFDPSSKMCSCGKINNNLKLSDRTWKCLCGLEHDRDILAANNIVKFATLKQNLVGQELPEITLGENDSETVKSLANDVR